MCNDMYGRATYSNYTMNFTTAHRPLSVTKFGYRKREREGWATSAHGRSSILEHEVRGPPDSNDGLGDLKVGKRPMDCVYEPKFRPVFFGTNILQTCPSHNIIMINFCRENA